MQAHDIATRLQRGLSAATNGNCEAALAELKAVILLDAGVEVALNTIGVCETRLGRPGNATKSFEQVTKLAPASWQGWTNLGANYLTLNQLDKAVPALRRATTLNPKATSAWSNLGLAFDAVGRHEESWRSLDRARRLDTRDPEIESAWTQVAKKLVTKAAAYIENQEYQKAKSLLLEVRNAFPNSAVWHNLLGYSEFKLMNREPALQHLQRAVQLQPDSEPYLLDLGEFFLVNRAVDAARLVFEAGLKELPSSEKLQLGLAMAFQLNKKYHESNLILRSLLVAKPQLELTYDLLGRSLENTGEFSEMIELGTRLQSVNQASSLAWYLIGAGLFGKAAEDDAKLTEAVLALEKSLSRDPSSTNAHFLLGKASEKLGSTEKALFELKETLRLDPHHQSAHYVLAQLYRKTGRSDLAAAEMEEHKLALRHREDSFFRLIVTAAPQNK